MKKTVFGLMLLAGACAFAGVDNHVIMFSTQGPDTYADGTVVLDGEFYALVWTPNGQTFGGIDAAGKAVEPSRILVEAPLAKDGRCPNVMFQIDEQVWKDEGLGNGKLAVYLLDSRKFKIVDGKLAKDAGGKPLVESWGLASGLVHGYGDTGVTVNEQFASAGQSVGITADAAAAVPTGAQALTIRDFKVLGDKVCITVSGASEKLMFGVRTGSDAANLESTDSCQYGAGTGDLTIILDKPSDDDGSAKLYQVYNY